MFISKPLWFKEMILKLSTGIKQFYVTFFSFFLLPSESISGLLSSNLRGLAGCQLSLWAILGCSRPFTFVDWCSQRYLFWFFIFRISCFCYLFNFLGIILTLFPPTLSLPLSSASLSPPLLLSWSTLSFSYRSSSSSLSFCSLISHLIPLIPTKAGQIRLPLLWPDLRQA